MKRIVRKGYSALLALAVAGSLGFGVTQAVARPSSDDGVARACTQCLRECGSLGGVFKSGRCLCCG